MDEEKFLGSVLFDMKQEDFEKNVVDNHLNMGQINGLIFWFEMMYHQFRATKDVIIDNVAKGIRDRNDPEVKRVLEELYAGLTNIEKKVVYLRNRYQELVKPAETHD